MKRLGILVALPEELRTLTRVKPDKAGLTELSPRILVACSGTGPERAVRAAQMLLEQDAGALLCWGCAAALRRYLRPGALLIPDGFIDSDGHRIQAHARWRQTLIKGLSPVLPVHPGRLLASRTLVTTVSTKATLAQQTHAVALDMESAAVASFAHRHKIPFNAIRSIADPVEMPLPLPVIDGLRQDGSVHLPRLFASLLRHPFELTGLITLGRQFKAAQNTLRQAASIYRHHHYNALLAPL